MIKKEIKKETVETIITRCYCDDCGKEVFHSYDYDYCHICGKLICNDCIEHEEDGGDYRGNCYCKSCWNFGEKYRNKIAILEAKQDKLMDEWYDKCKNNKK